MSWNIGVNDHTHAINIKPPQSVCTVYFRPMPGQDPRAVVGSRPHGPPSRQGLEFTRQAVRPGALRADPAVGRISSELLEIGGPETRSQTVCYGTDGGVLQSAAAVGGDRTRRHRAGPHLPTSGSNWSSSRREPTFTTRLIRTVVPVDERTIEAGIGGAAFETLGPRTPNRLSSGLLAPFVAERQLLERDRRGDSAADHARFRRRVATARLVGFAAVEIYSAKLAEVQCLAVDGRYQRKGVGRLLIEQCVARARRENVLELMAITSSDEFLRDCGFDYSLPDQKRGVVHAHAR